MVSKLKPGMVLVPREPTAEMLQGACDKHIPGKPMNPPGATCRRGRYHFPLSEEECPRFVARRKIWKSMIDAALTTSSGEM